MRRIKLIFICIISILLFSCRTIEYIPINNETVVEYRDTTIYKDSLIYIPKEVVQDITNQLDTLKMETSMAKAKAWVDTTHNVLRGSLENKKGIQYKYVYKDRLVTKDSIVYNEVPVPVDKIVTKHPPYERTLWILSIGFISILLYKLYKIYRKYMKI